MRMLPAEKIEILAIDIEALDEAVDDLAAVYWQLGRLAEFPLVLERLRANVADPRWQRKLTYHQAMAAHLLDDVIGARRELAKLGKLTSAEVDLDVLQLHLDINGESMPLVEKLKLYDRIIELTSSCADRIHYSVVKSVELTLAGDNAGAISVLDPALAAAREAETEKAFGPDSELWFCKLLEATGIAKCSREHFVEAAERLRRLLALTDFWTPSGQGHINRCLGDVCRLAGLWEDGAAAYAAGFALDADPACRIFEATCQLMQGRKEEALESLETVSFDEIGVPEQADYAIAYAAVAIALRDLPRLDDAAQKLKRVTPIRQYFSNENLKYQLAIERARATIAAGKPVPKSGRLLGWIGSVSRWLMLQPNIAGVGINLNNVMDDAVARRRKVRDTHDPGKSANWKIGLR
jgi:tetratricopeptide (TPR) repeat protein